MQLHTLRTKYKRKDKKRIGHGGKRGTTSGKGTKGQKSRTGHRIRPAQRDLIQRLPKLRGVKNPPLQKKAIAVNLTELERKMPGTVVDLKALVDAGLLRTMRDRVKILGDGAVARAFEIKGVPVSASAKTKIEKAGGKIVASSK